MLQINELLAELRAKIQKEKPHLSEEDLRIIIHALKQFQIPVGQALLDRYPTEQNCSLVMADIESLREEAIKQISSKVDEYLCHINTLAPPLNDKIKKMLIIIREK